MPNEFDLEDVLKRNPHIDRDRVEKATRLLRRLREKGLHRKGYELAPPFGGRRAVPKDAAPTPAKLARSRRPPHGG